MATPGESALIRPTCSRRGGLGPIGALKAAQGVFIVIVVILDANREEWRDHLPARTIA